ARPALQTTTMNEQSIRFRFGIFVLAALILLAVLTILFGGFPNYFKHTTDYTIVFANAPGIAPGTPVRRSGVRIGEVRSVTLDNETGEVKVEISVEERYMLRKADNPTLVQGLIGGDSAISFVPPENLKGADLTPVAPGAVLQGVAPADAGRIVQKTADLLKPAEEVLLEFRKLGPVAKETLEEFQKVAKMTQSVGPQLEKAANEVSKLAQATREQIPELKKTNEEIRETVRIWGKVGERTDVLLKVNEEKINRSVDRMEETLKRLNDVLGDENQKNLRDTLRNAKNGSKEFEELMKDSRVTVKQANDSLKRVDETLADLQKAMKPFSDSGPRIFKNLDEGTDSLNKTLKDLREIIQVVARNDGTIQRLLSDPSLYNNLNDSAAMTTKILPRLDRVLADVEIFADKIARHPELIGLRGAVFPSSGLKEAPTTQPYRVFPRPFHSAN
ncbi:MAG TPA: MlaD family protein, partial [Gemmataceae bacterium]|nr:MlaD family protein [Gemmataceae bacterium]